MGCSQSSPQVVSDPKSVNKSTKEGEVMKRNSSIVPSQSVVILPSVFVVKTKEQANHQNLSFVQLETRWINLAPPTISGIGKTKLPPLDTPESSVLSRKKMSTSRYPNSGFTKEKPQFESDGSPLNNEMAIRMGFDYPERMVVKKLAPPFRTITDNHVYSMKKVDKPGYKICVKGEGNNLAESFDDKVVYSPNIGAQSYKSGGSSKRLKEGGFAHQDLNHSVGKIEDIQDYIDRQNKFGRQIMKAKLVKGATGSGSLNIIEDLKKSELSSPVKTKSSFVLKQKEESKIQLPSADSFNQLTKKTESDAVFPKERRMSKHQMDEIPPIIMSPHRSHSQGDKVLLESDLKPSSIGRDSNQRGPINFDFKVPSGKDKYLQSKNSITLQPIKKMSSDVEGLMVGHYNPIKRIHTTEDANAFPGAAKLNNDMAINPTSSLKTGNRRDSIRLPVGQGKDIIKMVKKAKNSPSIQAPQDPAIS